MAPPYANTHILDGARGVGVSTSLTPGGDGLRSIGYFDVTNSDLKVAHCDDVFCAP